MPKKAKVIPKVQKKKMTPKTIQKASNQQKKVKGIETTPKRLSDNIAIGTEMTDLSAKYNCISLCEGSPNPNPPKYLIDEMNNAIQAGRN